MKKRFFMISIILTSLLVSIVVFLVFKDSIRKTESHKLISITGTIKDSRGEPIIATISVINSEGKIITREISNLDGRFSLKVKQKPNTLIISRGPEYEIIVQSLDITGTTYNTSVTLNRFINLSKQNWYSGELHQHTNKSDDGKVHADQVIRYNQSRGLRFAGLTDHNHVFSSDDYTNTKRDHPFLTLSSYELTTSLGDYNILNSDRLPDYTFENFDDLKQTLDQMNQTSIKQINHPFKEDDPFQFWNHIDTFDVMEIWHGIFRYDDAKNKNAKEKWFELLNSGSQIRATCGSDNHYLDRIYLLNREETIISNTTETYSEVPMIYVYTESFTKNGIAQAIKNGNSFLTNGPLILSRLNNQLPGSQILYNESNQLSLHIIDQLGINQVNVIRNGTVVKTINTNSTEIKETIPLSLTKGDWVVIECYGEHNGYAITNPFFIS
ncbi:CehA/McbA family metallohydrolase [Haloplasma contractile]|uniref:PHP domain protein n=1 Tax=Haloplasma contractile SSD-17B TaxID=1033810 RepID=U2E7L0_9MOLU|nr:CehA/McbA family metallohydrolase [Haloplasma contractile]ERJ11188.1 PHP domain protein [Haloplasma contractile SSD-17B]